MWIFQGNLFTWTGTYREILKSALVYHVLFHHFFAGVFLSRATRHRFQSKLEKIKKLILKKLHIFWEAESFSTPQEDFLYFKKRKPRKDPYISGNGTFLYFRKWKFFIFWDRYIQNCNTCRTLVYLKPETYSEHFQTSAMESFAKIAT